MHKIIKILGVEETKQGPRTHAVVEDGTEVIGSYEKFEVGQMVHVLWHAKWNMIKMESPEGRKARLAKMRLSTKTSL